MMQYSYLFTCSLTRDVSWKDTASVQLQYSTYRQYTKVLITPAHACARTQSRVSRDKLFTNVISTCSLGGGATFYCLNTPSDLKGAQYSLVDRSGEARSRREDAYSHRRSVHRGAQEQEGRLLQAGRQAVRQRQDHQSVHGRQVRHQSHRQAVRRASTVSLAPSRGAWSRNARAVCCSFGLFTTCACSAVHTYSVSTRAIMLERATEY